MKDNLEIGSKGFQLLLKTSYFLLEFNFRALPYFSFIVGVLCFLEAVTYPGFLNQHFYLNLLDVLVIYIVSGCLAGNSFVYLSKKYKHDRLVSQYGLLKNAYVLILPTIFVLILISYNSLTRHGDSLLLKGDAMLFPSRVFIGIGVTVYFLLIYFYFIEGKFKRVFALLGVDNAVIVLFVFALVFRLFLDVRTNFTSVASNFYSVALSGNFTFEQKVRSQIGPVYDYYMFINENTPEDSLILHPKQQGQWPDVSNEGYTRYFVFPRNLISEDSPPADKSDVDYVMLIGDKKLHDQDVQNRWPDFNLPTKKIVLFMQNGGGDSIEIYSDYNYEDFDYPDYWGIIEVDKERIEW